jgi:alkylmercury lyase
VRNGKDPEVAEEVAEMERERRERPDVGESAPSDPAALTSLAWLVRGAAFRAILATGEPWDPNEATIAGADAPSVRSAIDQLLAAGRVRTNQQGHVTASCGLSVDPTPHRIETSRGARWTQCAYDALGILGALGEAGTIETSSPATGASICIRFVDGRPEGSEAVLFLADQSSCCRPNDEWCPNVNLFEDRLSALGWAEAHEVPGRVVSLDEGTDLGTMEWRPLLEQTTPDARDGASSSQVNRSLPAESQ